MNEEAGFNLLLDQNIDDNITRLVYADWLQDHNDIRASGYRELGTKGYQPHYLHLTKNNRLRLFTRIPIDNVWTWRNDKYIYEPLKYILPMAMWNLLTNYIAKNGNSVYYPNRKTAEDAFAIAYSIYKLPLRQL